MPPAEQAVKTIQTYGPYRQKDQLCGVLQITTTLTETMFTTFATVEATNG